MGTKSICIHCRENIEHVCNGRWRGASNESPEYCFIDPVHGSRLHEPPSGVLYNIQDSVKNAAGEVEPAVIRVDLTKLGEKTNPPARRYTNYWVKDSEVDVAAPDNTTHSLNKLQETAVLRGAEGIPGPSVAWPKPAEGAQGDAGATFKPEVKGVKRFAEHLTTVPFTLFPAAPGDLELYKEMLRKYLVDFDILDEYIEKTLVQAEMIFKYKHMQSSSSLWLKFVLSYGKPVGFIVYNLQETNWSVNLRCYIEDIWIDPEHRRQGHATNVLDYMYRQKEANNWAQVYWTTEIGNEEAQGLYDKVALKRDCYVYEHGSLI